MQSAYEPSFETKSQTQMVVEEKCRWNSSLQVENGKLRKFSSIDIPVLALFLHEIDFSPSHHFRSMNMSHDSLLLYHSSWYQSSSCKIFKKKDRWWENGGLVQSIPCWSNHVSLWVGRIRIKWWTSQLWDFFTQESLSYHYLLKELYLISAIISANAKHLLIDDRIDAQNSMTIEYESIWQEEIAWACSWSIKKLDFFE